MGIRNLIFGVNSVTALYLIRYGSLLQTATDVITKCDSYFITKCDRSLLQNASGFLLQNATILLQNATLITKFDVYYKIRSLLQIATFMTNCDTYYKIRRLLQNSTFITNCDSASLNHKKTFVILHKLKEL